MSLGDFKLGEPIEQGVAEKIEALQTVFGDTTDSKDRQSYIQLQQAVPWIRMQSGVQLDEDKAKTYNTVSGNLLAKQNILFGLNARVEATDDNGKLSLQSYQPNNGILPGYEQTDYFGIRPKPGITGMTIHSHNRFGSLRTAVVNFQCWSKEQIDALEVLYMRPGYTVLLEWGHSQNLRVEPGGTPDGIADMDLGIDFYDSKYTSATNLRNDIIQKRKDNHFGYDAIVGTIKNFTWKLRKDGGYDCSTSLVTAGDLIESYKANFFLSQGTILSDLNKELEKLKDADNPTAQIFPNLFRDDIQDTAPEVGDALDNLMRGFAQQANAAILQIADFIDVGGGFDSMYPTAEKTERERSEIFKTYFQAVPPTGASTDGDPVPYEYPRIIQGITANNYNTIRIEVAKVLRKVQVVDTSKEEHRFQGVALKDQILSAHNIHKQRTYYGGEIREYFLQTKWPVLVSFITSNGTNGFDGSGTPDLTIPDGGRAAFQIPYKDRYEVITEFAKAFNRGNPLYGATYTEHENNGDTERENKSQIMQLYGLILSLIPNISIDALGLENAFYADQANVGDPNGTGLTGDPSDIGGNDWIDARKRFQKKNRLSRKGTSGFLGGGNGGGVGSKENLISTMVFPLGDEKNPPPVLYTDSTTNTIQLPQGVRRDEALSDLGYAKLTPLSLPTIISNPIVNLHGVDTPFQSVVDLFEDFAFDPTKESDYYAVVKYGFPVKQGNVDNSVTRFMVMQWSGFDPEIALEASTVTGIDEITNAQYSYHDPNDDYVSKLHYYLRTKIESPYVQAYLSQDFTGRGFRSVFQYRKTTNQQEIYNDVLATPGSESIKREDIKLPVTAQVLNLLGGRFQSENDLQLRNYVYIRLGVLLEILNKHVLRTDREYFFTFQSAYTRGRAPEYLTFDDHISTDPRVCILPHTLKRVLDDTLIPGEKLNTKPEILDIEVSISYILETLNRFIGAEGRVPMLGFMQSLLDGIARVCGDQNSFALQYMEDDSVFHVVDRRSLARTSKSALENNAKINVFGLNSIVRDVNLVSKITAKMSSMVAISAQANPYTAQDEATGFNGINKGLTDQIYRERYEIERNTVEQDAKNYDQLRDRLRKDIVGVITHLGFFYELATIPRHSVDTQVNVYANYCKFLFGGDARFRKKGSRSTYSFIIPFELHLGMYGISGLRVMDSFIINKDLLPNTYGGDENQPVGFLITGVEHQVDKSNWSTKIKTQIYNIDENPSSVELSGFSDLKDDFVAAVEHIQLGTTGIDGAVGANVPDLKPGVDIFAINTLADPDTAGTKHYLISNAKIKFEEMFTKCYEETGLYLKIKSSYRTASQ